MDLGGENTMNRYKVILSSIVDGATVRIQFPVNSPMSSLQLRTYYLLKGGFSVSDVEVFE
jgi:hypothetical protein